MSAQAFVDVLTTYGNDPRGLVEVRASEAALRAQVAELKQQLQVSRVGFWLSVSVRRLQVCWAGCVRCPWLDGWAGLALGHAGR